MSFGARQYDPQLGRFLSVDPMASAGGQDMLSPYQAMGNNPVSGTDPGGTETGQPGGNLPPPPGGAPPVMSDGLYQAPVGPPGGLWQVSIDGPLMGFSAAVLNDVAGNVNTDPMDLEGQMAGGSELGAFVMAVLQAGGFLNVITGSQPVSSQIINNLTMSEGNGSGGGASDDAGGDPGDPPSGNDKGNGDGHSGDNSSGSSIGETAKEQTGNVGLGLGVIAYEMGKSSSLGFSKLGNMVGNAGDAFGFAGLYFDYKNYQKGTMSGGRFSYHAGSFIASFTISRAIGTAAGLETGGFLFYLETVQLEGQVPWNSFKASYNSWYQQSVMTIENGGNPFEHMHYSF